MSDLLPVLRVSIAEGDGVSRIVASEKKPGKEEKSCWWISFIIELLTNVAVESFYQNVLVIFSLFTSYMMLSKQHSVCG